MRVLCIQEPNTIVKCGINDTAQVHIGSEYNAADAIEYEGEYYYKLEEIPGALFHERLFATLPDQTANEMAEESREAIVNLETVLV